MLEYETKLKTWGNSIGLVVPRERIKEENLKVNQEVKIMIFPRKMLKVKDIFGKLKWKKSTEQIMKEVDKELGSKFLNN